MLCEVLPELCTICTAYTMERLSQRDVTVNLTSVWQSDSGAPSARVYQGERRIYLVRQPGNFCANEPHID